MNMNSKRRVLTAALLAAPLAALHPAAPSPSTPFGEATPASAIQVLRDFRIERLYSMPRSEGSLIALCFDDRGNIYAAEHGPKLFRITPPPLGASPESAAKVEVAFGDLLKPDPRPPIFGMVQGMAFVDGSLYLVRHGDLTKEHFLPDAIVRLKDTDGDGRLDAAARIFEFPAVPDENPGWHEHGVHGIARGPDGKSIYVIGGDRNRLPSDKSRTPPHRNRDAWGQRFEKEPFAGGWVMRADLDGRNAEVLCTGLRNGYRIAFNHQGDLFTFDSDLEFTVGMPEYRPTAIRQILSGTDSGWAGRAGAMEWSWTPTWEDIQPPVKNIGPGSPTGVCFGYGARFPAKYQEALFACDWSYGRLLAVHLKTNGAGYTAEAETFLSAAGLPISDLAVSPVDGAMYFVTGGRGTQSGLYRITYRGAESTAAAASRPVAATTAALQAERRKLESFHGAPNPAALDFLWPRLAHEDRAIRGAARIALEWQPVAEWKARALSERNPRIALQSLLALARSTDAQTGVQQELLDALDRLGFAKLGPDEQCWFLRILAVSAIRHGSYPPDVAAKLVARLEPHLPSPDRRVNEEIVAACSALGSTTFHAKTLDLLERSRTQEEQILFTRALLHPLGKPAWTHDQRERFLKLSVQRVPYWKGGSSVKPLRESVLASVVAMLAGDERRQFAELIAAAGKPAGIVPTIPRGFVKHWTVEDIAPALVAGSKAKRDLRNGRNLFTATGCILCHNFRGEGGLAGPDLTGAGGRYTPLDLADNILNPSKVINEQYSLSIYTRKDGSQVVGRLVNMSQDTLMVATNPMDPGGSELRFSSKEVASVAASSVSLMPEGLLDTLTEADVLDLLAYLTRPPAP